MKISGGFLIFTSGSTSKTLKGLLGSHPDISCDSDSNCSLMTSMNVEVFASGIVLTGRSDNKSELFYQLLLTSPGTLDKVNRKYGYYGYNNPKNKIDNPVISVGGFGDEGNCGDLCNGGNMFFRVDLSSSL